MEAQAQANFNGSTRLGSYLRKLRSGYGYSLRRVEERARAEGGEIDNSQLSRYEKGICYPSFDKLRVLANVFNVSIQSFSDVVDLETYEDLKPAGGSPEVLVQDGLRALRSGDNGRAFAIFEGAIEALIAADPGPEQRHLLGQARVSQAAALTRLGKLALAEQELRNALRSAETLSEEFQARALLALANIHADQGDSFLAEMEAEKADVLARSASLSRLSAMAVHTVARVLYDQGHADRAIENYREAAKLYSKCEETYEATRVRINIGTCYVVLGKAREGIRMLRSSIIEARNGSHRRLEAFAWRSLGLAYYRQKDFRRARGCFRESDALAVYNNERQIDILFFNAYYEWKMAGAENNPTREKIALGRLKTLRSSLERKFPEVDDFDQHIERGRAHA